MFNLSSRSRTLPNTCGKCVSYNTPSIRCIRWAKIVLNCFVNINNNNPCQTATESNELNITLSPPTMQDTSFSSRPPPGISCGWFMMAINYSINSRTWRDQTFWYRNIPKTKPKHSCKGNILIPIHFTLSMRNIFTGWDPSRSLKLQDFRPFAIWLLK